jgi:hypothetical protein
LKFLVDNKMKKSMTHIYCPVINHEKIEFDDFSQPIKIVGEYDSKINEIDLFEAEEHLEAITSEKAYHDDLVDLIKEYIKHQHETEKWTNGLNTFEIEIYKRPLKD